MELPEHLVEVPEHRVEVLEHDFLSTEQKFELVMDGQEQNLIFSTPEMQARLAAEWEWEWDLIECYVVGNS